MYPVFLDITDRLAVVIGGVGRRPAEAAFAARRRRPCSCRMPGDAAGGLRPSLTWTQAPYVPAHLDGAILAFAAATGDVNVRVVADAAAAGIWVNSATDPDAGNFIVPATLRRGDFAVAVSTGGAAPLLARLVRDRLEQQFDETIGVWVQLLEELRPLVQSRSDRGEEIWRRLCRWEWLDRIRTEGIESVRAAMRADAGVADK